MSLLGAWACLRKNWGYCFFNFLISANTNLVGEEFLPRLSLFLKRATEVHGSKFAVEIRNKTWLNSRLTDLLGEYKVALALTDTSFMPRPWEHKEKFDLITAEFTYVRFLGDRKGIEKLTQTWDKTIVDRRDDLTNSQFGCHIFHKARASVAGVYFPHEEGLCCSK